jgi:HSP20 family protein
MFLVPMTRTVRPTPLSTSLLDAMFDDAFFAGTRDDDTRSPALDVVETDTHYTVTAELPGVAKEDIKVAIDGKRVDVSAQAKSTAERKEGERLVHRERTQRHWSRSFTLAQEIDQVASSAKLEHGVLTLTLTKKAAPTAAQLTIN